jgi:hypothetical protein
MSEMDLQTICELLLKIEQEVDVNDMFHEDAHLWPLVRQFIWVNSVQGNNRQNKSSGKENKIAALSKKKPTILDHLNHIAHNSETAGQIKRYVKTLMQFFSFSQQAADVCFLSQPIYYSETLNGRPYSRIIDPFYELLSPQLKCVKLEESDSSKKNPCRKYSCNYFNVVPLRAQVEQEVSGTIQRFRKILREINCIVGGEEAELVRGLSVGLQTAIKYRDTYTILLNKLKPKLVFLASYYFPQFMGLNWAARLNSIQTVDIQHGKQGKFHGMYSHWSQIPEKGYALLPTWFWSWGNSSAENIMRWQVDRKAHRCIVGGFPWISRWNTMEIPTKKFQQPIAEKIILVTTQAPVGGMDDFFPEMLVDAITQSPLGWCWIIREHPNYPRGNMVIKEKLKSVDSHRYIMNVYNNISLYALLSKCDFHVTAFSSVCYEAEYFSVPTVIFSRIGKALYAQEIESGRFIYCDDGVSLIDAISCNKFKKSVEKYIESDINLTLSALQTLTRNSGLIYPLDQQSQ